MRLLMPQYRRWAVAAEAAFVMLLIGSMSVIEFHDHHNGLGWFTASMAFLALFFGVLRWRREGRRATFKK